MVASLAHPVPLAGFGVVAEQVGRTWSLDGELRIDGMEAPGW